MQFQAERVQPDCRQSALHHGKCRHLFRNKQDRLSLIQCIGNHIGDRLGFAGSGRSMQHKALSLCRGCDRYHLGRIRAERYGQIGRCKLFVDIPRIDPEIFRLPGHMPFQKTLYHFTGLKIFGTVAQVVPHHKLPKGKQSQKAEILHIPALFIHHSLPDRLKYQRQVDAMLILRQRIQPADLNAMILPEVFQQGDIDLRFLVPAAHDVTVVFDAAYQFCRDQYQRCVTRFFRDLGLIPAQKSRSDKQRIGTVFLQTELGRSLQAF